jgi:hypothetical protein
MRLSIPCVRRIGGCTNRLAKARIFPGDPAIRSGAGIVDKFFDKDLLQLFRRSQQYFWWALFLRRFAERTKALAHVDIHARTPKAKPGRPEGAQVLAIRLLYDLLDAHFGARYIV